MNGGESSIQNAISAVLGELKRQSELNDSTVFAYEPKHVGQLVAYANAEDQKKILRLLDKQGKIKLTEKLVHNDATMQFEAMGGLPDDLLNSMKSGRLIVDVSTTDFGKPITANNGHRVWLLLKNGNLMLRIDSYDERIAAKVHYGRGTDLLLTKLFSTSPESITVATDIFHEKDKNLKQVLSSSRLDFMLPFLNDNQRANQLSLKQMPITVDSIELLSMLRKIKEKYVNNFDDIINILT